MGAADRRRRFAVDRPDRAAGPGAGRGGLPVPLFQGRLAEEEELGARVGPVAARVGADRRRRRAHDAGAGRRNRNESVEGEPRVPSARRRLLPQPPVHVHGPVDQALRLLPVVEPAAVQAPTRPVRTNRHASATPAPATTRSTSMSSSRPATAGYLKHDFLHYAYPDLATWVEKHNRYSTWEAHAMLGRARRRGEGVAVRRADRTAAMAEGCRPPAAVPAVAAVPLQLRAQGRVPRRVSRLLHVPAAGVVRVHVERQALRDDAPGGADDRPATDRRRRIATSARGAPGPRSAGCCGPSWRRRCSGRARGRATAGGTGCCGGSGRRFIRRPTSDRASPSKSRGT